MSKKHFERIASILSWARKDEASSAVVDKIAADLMAYFCETNPRFNAVRFLSATKYTPPKGDK